MTNMTQMSFIDGDILTAGSWNQMEDNHEAYIQDTAQWTPNGVAEGFIVSTGGGMNVIVSAGSGMVEGIPVISGGTTTLTLSASDANWDRADSIYITAGNQIGVETGSPAASYPEYETLGTGSEQIAGVIVKAGSSAVYSADIRDCRYMIGKGARPLKYLNMSDGNTATHSVEIDFGVIPANTLKERLIFQINKIQNNGTDSDGSVLFCVNGSILDNEPAPNGTPGTILRTYGTGDGLDFSQDMHIELKAENDASGTSIEMRHVLLQGV